LFVLCRSVYCLCVNVYCTTATGWQPNCSQQIYHIIRTRFLQDTKKTDCHSYCGNFGVLRSAVSSDIARDVGPAAPTLGESELVCMDDEVIRGIILCLLHECKSFCCSWADHIYDRGEKGIGLLRTSWTEDLKNSPLPGWLDHSLLPHVPLVKP